jgi:hypothetical protein
MNTRDDIARKLADAHRVVEPTIVRISRIRTPREEIVTEPIKLLEVNRDTSPSGIVPIAFGPSGSIPVPSVVVEITPEEFEKLSRHELKLPLGWELGETLYEAVGEAPNGGP